MSLLPLDTDPYDSFFVELLDSLAPDADDLIVLLKSYFDESYGVGTDLLCVAGYVFTSRNAREFDAAWKRMLKLKKNLPYFRMSACNVNKSPFDQFTEDECIAVSTQAIKLINKYAAAGCAVTIDEAAFDQTITSRGVVSTPYELGTWLAMASVQYFMRSHPARGPISYVFEAGFRDQGIANKMMDRIFKSPKLRSQYDYKSHTFIDKRECRPLQAADLFAWQWFKNAKRQKNGATKPRGDLAALLAGSPHFAHHIDLEALRTLVGAINTKAGTPLGNEIAGLAMRDPTHPIFPKRAGETGDAAAYAQLLKDHEGRS